MALFCLLNMKIYIQSFKVKKMTVREIRIKKTFSIH